MFIHDVFYIFKKKGYRAFCLPENCQHDRCLSAEDKIWLGQIRSGFLDAFDTINRTVSFPLEDKHVVNEHHVIQKSHDATQKKMSSRGAFQRTTWLVWNKLAASKTLLWGRQKNRVSRCTEKSNIKRYTNGTVFQCLREIQIALIYLRSLCTELFCLLLIFYLRFLLLYVF